MRRMRYFKATDGTNTYFRSSPTRVYESMSIVGSDFVMHRDGRGPFPVIEIDKEEYFALVDLKRHRAPWATAPRDSWVENWVFEKQAS